MSTVIDAQYERKATLTLSLKADSGYASAETHRVSADQWGRILTICGEAAREKEPEHVRYDGMHSEGASR